MELIGQYSPEITYNIKFTQREINSIYIALRHIPFETMEQNAKVDCLKHLDWAEWENLLHCIEELA